MNVKEAWHRMAHVHVGDRTLLNILSLAIFPGLQLLRLRHPAVTLAEETDEERLHAINRKPHAQRSA